MENKQPLIEEMDILINNLNDIKNALQTGDREELEKLLAKSRQVKEGLGE